MVTNFLHVNQKKNQNNILLTTLTKINVTFSTFTCNHKTTAKSKGKAWNTFIFTYSFTHLFIIPIFLTGCCYKQSIHSMHKEEIMEN